MRGALSSLVWVVAVACASPPRIVGEIDLGPVESVRASDFPGITRAIETDVAVDIAATLGLELHRDGQVERRLIHVVVDRTRSCSAIGAWTCR